ncbi:tripartite tricarboxylate transporter permease [Halomonas sp. MC140]|nr:tripartite tricarboxylate transporter permease [Halomonas sp. MC140]MDN7130873.1 tripartite tricarboxylate transporter permease [Halomonas sp. MC140]
MVMNALALLFTPTTLGVMLACALYGLVIGAIPGFSAAMAVALMVPVSYFLDPVPALAGVVTLCAMGIFSGDIPGALLRIPGTPASAAYVDESYRMTQKGQAGLALGTGLVCSSIGGIFGSIVLIFAAPSLGNLALQFSSVEYFWLACMGLTAAIAVSQGSTAKGVVSLSLGLLIAMVGLDPVSGQPRFAFGTEYLSGGLGFIPVLIGLFALSEVFRFALSPKVDELAPVGKLNDVFRGVLTEIKRMGFQILQGCGIGTLVGAIPGAGADIASYIAYASTKKQSRHPEKFGTGIVDGIASASAANNASIGGALVPATVFGIPGDSLTAVIIGVLYMKGLNPGPTVFLTQGDLITAVFLAFLLANILIVPFGYLAIRIFRHILAVPRTILMPLIIAACIIGAFAVENTVFAVVTMLCAGILGFFMEENGFPLAPAILGVVLAPIVEENFLNTLVKSNGDMLVFFSRPIALALAVITIAIWVVPPLLALLRRYTGRVKST